MVQRGELQSYGTKPCLSRGQVETVAEMRCRFRMSATEAADRLGVAPATVLRWLDIGAIPGHRTVRGRWWLDPDDVWRIRTGGRELVGLQEAAEILGVSRTRVSRTGRR
jgi:excisionase family DNA binding protein